MRLLIPPDSWRQTLLWIFQSKVWNSFQKADDSCEETWWSLNTRSDEKIMGCPDISRVSCVLKRYVCDQTRSGGMQPILSWASHAYATYMNWQHDAVPKWNQTIAALCADMNVAATQTTSVHWFSNSLFCRCNLWNDICSPWSLFSNNQVAWNWQDRNVKWKQDLKIVSLKLVTSWTGLSSKSVWLLWALHVLLCTSDTCVASKTLHSQLKCGIKTGWVDFSFLIPLAKPPTTQTKERRTSKLA